MRGKQARAAGGRAQQRALDQQTVREQADRLREQRLREARARESSALACLLERLEVLEALQPGLQRVADAEEALSTERAAAKRELAALRDVRRALMKDFDSGQRDGLISRELLDVVNELRNEWGAIDGTHRDDVLARMRGDQLHQLEHDESAPGAT